MSLQHWVVTSTYVVLSPRTGREGERSCGVWSTNQCSKRLKRLTFLPPTRQLGLESVGEVDLGHLFGPLSGTPSQCSEQHVNASSQFDTFHTHLLNLFIGSLSSVCSCEPVLGPLRAEVWFPRLRACSMAENACVNDFCWKHRRVMFVQSTLHCPMELAIPWKHAKCRTCTCLELNALFLFKDGNLTLFFSGHVF